MHIFDDSNIGGQRPPSFSAFNRNILVVQYVDSNLCVTVQISSLYYDSKCFSATYVTKRETALNTEEMYRIFSSA